MIGVPFNSQQVASLGGAACTHGPDLHRKFSVPLSSWTTRPFSVGLNSDYSAPGFPFPDPHSVARGDRTMKKDQLISHLSA